jgi:hypothetical protein
MTHSTDSQSRPDQRFARVAIGIGCILFANVASADDDTPSVTPYRPSVSTPAALSAPGWIEVEAGVNSSGGVDPSRRENLPYTVKLAFTPDWGVRIGGDAIVHERAADGTGLTGFGDTSVVLKRRFAVSDASAFGLEAGVKFPTARTGLGSGSTDATVNGIFSSDFAKDWHTDINLLATRVGGVEEGVSRFQNAWAAAVSRNLTEKLGVVGEMSGTHQRGIGPTSQGLVAMSYSVAPSLTVDLGVSKGFSAASGGWSMFSGLTFLAAKLF